ncbi:MAG TPA: excinuclease ABC subunit UvrC [Flavobacteriaceae bacterium]|nr:excinuclease ABC subunit UvrC [Flavobacteriaceae bacterium]
MEELPIKLQLATLPKSPGVYQFYDKDEKILYVGKAINLKKRVSSYFNKTHDSARTRMLVKRIVQIKHIVVETETDALLLENNLIKEYQPRYNVLLKDDKTYPWICIKNERFPRVFHTRNLVKDGSEYFGPYTSMRTVRTLLNLIRSLYPLRTCNYLLSRENVSEGRYKVCLEYHIGNCLGPCEGLQTEEDYMKNIDAVRNIIRGDFRGLLQEFRAKMKAHAENMEFEMAQQIKEKIDTLESYHSKSTVVNPKIHNVDVFTVLSDESFGYVNFLQIAFGRVIRSHTMEIRKKMEESDKELLRLAIIELRERFNSQSEVVYLPFSLNLGEYVKVEVPKIGDKKHIVDLSLRNAKYFRMERFKQMKIVDPKRHENRILTQMKTDLRMNELPRHIECFDNSNLQGTNPVAACVVFKNAKPSKRDYRKFNIKSVEGPDDYESMREVVYRRYKRLLEEEDPLPQLIVIDGGKGQLNAALESLSHLNLENKIAVIGIAERLDEIFVPDDPIPLFIDKSSETLRVIQQLRNEAHRFGLSFHRQKRSKNALHSDLENIPGVGPKTIERLLRHFKSLKRIKSANFEELSSVAGNARATAIIEYYKDNI